MDAKPKLASYHQIFLAPSEEEKGSLPAPDDGSLQHVFSLTYRAGKSLTYSYLSSLCKYDLVASLGYEHCRHSIEKGKLC